MFNGKRLDLHMMLPVLPCLSCYPATLECSAVLSSPVLASPVLASPVLASPAIPVMMSPLVASRVLASPSGEPLLASPLPGRLEDSFGDRATMITLAVIRFPSPAANISIFRNDFKHGGWTCICCCVCCLAMFTAILQLFNVRRRRHLCWRPLCWRRMCWRRL